MNGEYMGTEEIGDINISYPNKFIATETFFFGNVLIHEKSKKSTDICREITQYMEVI